MFAVGDRNGDQSPSNGSGTHPPSSTGSGQSPPENQPNGPSSGRNGNDLNAKPTSGNGSHGGSGIGGSSNNSDSSNQKSSSNTDGQPSPSKASPSDSAKGQHTNGSQGSYHSSLSAYCFPPPSFHLLLHVPLPYFPTLVVLYHLSFIPKILSFFLRVI